MGRGSLKQSRRRTNSQSETMAPSSMSRALSTSARFNPGKSLLPLVLVLLCVVSVLYVTSRTSFYVVSLPLYSYQVVNVFPHDPKAFTQGLLYGGNDTLFESTGLYGESSVRRVLLRTGEVLALHKMDSSYFGEGLTLLGERLFQVTWLRKTGFIYDSHNLTRLGTFTHSMSDGWGLATDGNVIFGSDGTSTLYKLNRESLEVIEKATVKSNEYEVYRLNELEYVNGEIWANVWMSDCIARISPKDGTVIGWILLHSLRQELLSSTENAIDCLNGIAWDEEKNRLFVTGKLWPKLFEIKLRPLKGKVPRRIEDICLSTY